jgi:hypothetical protein
MSTDPITINFTYEDVREMALDEGIPLGLASERADEWGPYIEDTARSLCMEQLRSAIVTGQP